MKKTIYIAGKVTGVPQVDREDKFQRAEDILTAYGWETVNPTKLVTNPYEDWATAMEICLSSLKKCSAIYMLPCSVDSPGAQLELQKAIEWNLDIYSDYKELDSPTNKL